MQNYEELASKLATEKGQLQAKLDAALLQVGELKAKGERLMAEWHDMDVQRKELIVQKYAARAELDDAVRLIERMRNTLEEIAHSPSRSGHWSEALAEDALSEKPKNVICAKCNDSGLVPVGLGIVRCECREKRNHDCAKDHPGQDVYCPPPGGNLSQ